METVRRLTRAVRIQAKYDQSLEVSNYLKARAAGKTGVMLGLGKTREEVIETLHDLKNVNVDVVTMVNIQPSKASSQGIHHPDNSKNEEIGLDLGFVCEK